MKKIIVNEHEFEIKNVDGHYEAIENGKFICSGDTYAELEETLREDFAE